MQGPRAIQVVGRVNRREGPRAIRVTSKVAKREERKCLDMKGEPSIGAVYGKGVKSYDGKHPANNHKPSHERIRGVVATSSSGDLYDGPIVWGQLS